MAALSGVSTTFPKTPDIQESNLEDIASSSAAGEKPDAAAIFQERLAAAFKATAPVFGTVAKVGAQMAGVDPISASLIGESVEMSVQNSAEPAADISVQGAVKCSEVVKNSFDANKPEES